MRKTLLTLGATAAIALGGVSTAPQPANAIAWWVAPAIVGGVVVGAAAGAIAGSHAYAAPNAYAYVPAQPGPDIYVRPSAAPRTCFWARQRVAGGWQRIRVCD